MLGQDLLICDSSGSALIAAARSCEIVTECEMIETASPTSGTARTYIAGRTGWSITVGYLTSAPTTDLAKLDGEAVTVQVKIRGGASVQGSAFFERCVVTGTVGSLAKGSFVLRGTGPLGEGISESNL